MIARRAVRLVEREAARLIRSAGIWSEHEVLASVVTLQEQLTTRPRPRMTGPTWRQFCDHVSAAYALGLVTALRCGDLQFIVNNGRRTTRRKKARR